MISAEEPFANFLRAGASLIRITHGADCPDHATHRDAAAVLDAAAETVESGGALSARELARLEAIARTYRHAGEPAEVLA